MAANENLPFARGETYFGVGAQTITQANSDAAGVALIGSEYVVRDPDYNGAKVTLRIMQLTGANITATAQLVDLVGETAVSFSDQIPAAGERSFPLDHKYVGKVISQYDLCYVVVDGPCEATGGATIAAGLSIMAQGTDGEFLAATSTNWAIGLTVDAASNGTTTTIMVTRGHAV